VHAVVLCKGGAPWLMTVKGLKNAINVMCGYAGGDQVSL